jgi:deoxycytidylate deaminase
MNRNERFLSMAMDCAQQSTMQGRHGCIITLHGKVVASGYNSLRNYSRDKLLRNCCSCHAEIDAIRNAQKRKVGHR